MTPRTPETSMIWDSIYLTAEQMKLLDTAAGRFGVSEKELMRSAGEAIYREVIAAVPDGDIAVVCGSGMRTDGLGQQRRRRLCRRGNACGGRAQRHGHCVCTAERRILPLFCGALCIDGR